MPQNADPGLVALYSDGAVHALWREDWAPAGAVVELRVVDAAGQPLTQGIAIAYDGASATLTGTALAEGVALRLELVARAPDDSAAALTVRTLPGPDGVTLVNRAGGILVRWNAAVGAASYRIQVLDQTGTPLTSTPAIQPSFGGDELQALVAGDVLEDGAVYGVRVAGYAAGSLSPWSAAATLTLDKTTPASALLLALRARLRAAGAAATLGPDLIGEPAITRLFGGLLGAAGDGIALSGAATTSTTDDVTVRATASLLGRDVPVTAVFRDQNGLALTLTAPLGAMTLADMHAAGALPGSMWQVGDWGATLGGFDALVLTLDSAAASLRIGGGAGATAWNVLGIAGASLGMPQPDLVVALPAGAPGKTYDPGFKTQLSLGDTSLPVRVVVPSGVDGWRIALDAPDGVDFNAFSMLAPLFGAGDSGLPAGVVSIGNFHLDHFSIGFEPGNALWRFALGLSVKAVGAVPPAWTIIENVLVVDNLSADLRWMLFTPPGGTGPTATASGVLLGRILVAGQPVDALIDVPVGPNGWRLATSAPIVLAGADRLGQFTGGDGSVVAGALSSLGTASGLSLDLVEARFHPPPTASIDSIAIGLSATSFSVPGLDWLHVDQATFDLEIEQPTQPTRVIRASAGVDVTLGGGFKAAGRIERDDQLLSGYLTAATLDPVGAEALTGVISAEQFSGSAPAEVGSSFLLRRLDFSYRLDQSYLASAGLDMAAALNWELIPDAVVLEGIVVQLFLNRAAAGADWDSQARLLAVARIAGARFLALAKKDSTGWTVGFELDPNQPLSLTALTDKILGGTLNLPADFPVVSLDTAKVSIVAATLATQAALSTSVHWGPSVLGATGDMASLSLALDVGARPATGDRPYTLTIAGQLAISGLPTLAAVCTTGSGTTRTELLATIAPADLQALTPESAATSLAGAGNSLAAVEVPAGFTVPSFSSAAFYADLTSSTVMLFGQLERLGTAALIARELPAADGGASTAKRYGAALLIDVTGPFAFADILPGRVLAPFDEVLQVQEASLILSTFDMPAGEDNAFAGMARLTAAAGTLPAPPPMPAPPQVVAVSRGLNFAAKLTLTGAFWENLKFILEVHDSLAIRARFDPAIPANTQFTASLTDLTLLQVLHFDRLDIAYSPNSATTLTMSCAGSLQLPTFKPAAAADQPDEPATTILSFTGDLAVGDTVASALFATQPGALLRHPLGIPGITINQIGVALGYAFTARSDGTVERKLTKLAVQGSITLGAVLDLRASVLFVSAAPEIVLVELTKPVSVNDLFDQCIGTDAFAGLPTLSFKSGRLYYARTAVAAAGSEPAYLQGFHLDTVVDAFGVEFALALAITENDGVAGSASTVHPLDFGFVTVTGPAGGESGPGLRVAALKSTGAKEFALIFGFRLFGLDFTDGSLSYTTGGTAAEPVYAGTIAYHGSTPFGDNPSLSVEWTRTGGFKVVNWPGALALAADLSKLMEAAGASDACGVLGALGLDQDFLKGECKTDIKLSRKEGASEPTVHVEVRITYEISIPGPNSSRIVLNPGMTPILVPLDVTAPKEVSLATLAEKVGKAVLDALGGLIDDIIHHPEALAEFVAAVAVKKLSTQAVSSLICRNVDNEALKEEYKERTSEDQPSDQDTADEEIEKANNSADSAWASSTVEGAIAGAEAAAAAAGIAISFLGGLISALKSLFGAESDEEKAAKRRQDQANAARDRAAAAVVAKLAVSGVAAAYAGGGRLTVSWNAVSGDGLSYVVVVTVPDRGGTRNVNPEPMGVSGTSIDLTDPAILPGAALSISVVARKPRDGMGFMDFYSGDPTLIPFTVLDFGPHALVVEQVETALQAAWSAGPNPATGWSVSAAPTDGSIPPVAGLLTAAATSWSLPGPQAGKSYAIAVAPLGASYVDPPAKVIIPVSALAAAAGIAGFYDAEAATLRIDWQPSAGQAGSRAQIRLADGPTASRDLAADVSHVVEAVPAGTGICTFRVAALGPEPTDGSVRPAVWSAWTTLALSAPAAPAVQRVEYRAPDLVAFWPPLEGATGYEAILHEAGPPLGQPVTGVVQEGIQPSAAFAGPFADQQRLIVQLRTRSDKAAGNWSPVGADGAASHFTVRVVPPPANLRVVNGDDAVSLAWDASAGADSYRILLLDAQGTPLATQPVPQPVTGVSATLDGAALADGESYGVALRAVQGACWSLPASASFVRAPARPGQFVTLHNTLDAAAPGEDAASTSLIVTLMSVVAKIVVEAGETTPLGATRVEQFWIERRTTRSGVPAFESYALTVTAIGGHATLAFGDLENGRVPAGMTLVVGKGYHLGGSDLFASNLTPVQMAMALVNATDRSAIPGLLLDVYPTLDAAGLAGAFAEMGTPPNLVAAALRGVADRLQGGPTARLAALTAAFNQSPDRPSPLELVATFAEAEGEPPLSLADRGRAVMGAFPALPATEALELAALALLATGATGDVVIATLDPLVPAGCPITAATAVSTMTGNTPLAAQTYLHIMSLLGFDLLSAGKAVSALFAGKLTLAQLYAALRTIAPTASPALMLYTLWRFSALDTAATAMATSPDHQVPLLALAPAMRAIVPSPVAVKAFLAGITDGDVEGAAKAVADAYLPDASQLAWLIRTSTAYRENRIASALIHSGFSVDDSAAAVAEIASWLDAAAIRALLEPRRT